MKDIRANEKSHEFWIPGVFADDELVLGDEAGDVALLGLTLADLLAELLDEHQRVRQASLVLDPVRDLSNVQQFFSLTLHLFVSYLVSQEQAFWREGSRERLPVIEQ